MAEGPYADLTNREAELLIEGLKDDISFDIALILLGLRANPPAVNAPPDTDTIDLAFEVLQRLGAKGLITIGRVGYEDPSTPPGTLAPVRHIEEPIDAVRARVRRACADASEIHEWAFSCWLVNTDAGDSAARWFLAE